MHSRFVKIPFERIKIPVFKPFFCVPCILVCSGTTLLADWQDEIGFTRLQSIAGAELPTSPSQGYSQIESTETAPPVYSFQPDTSNPLFTGKAFTNKSASTGSGTSGHATHVATNFYGSTSQLPGAAPVDLYYAGAWTNSDFLRMGTSSIPRTESRAVQNHSWILTTGWTSSQVVEANHRLDYAINQNGFVCVVGANNGTSTTLPQFLGQSYHTISVGRDDGGHSAGFTAYDGTGRIKPDIVAPSAAPEYATSWTTPMVAGAAGLLYAKLSASPYSLTGADRPRVIKALLLASATKNTVPSWANTSTRPLDLRYGAGELNTYHAYSTLRSGEVSASNSIQRGIRAWAADTVNENSTKTYYFTIPAGAPSTPFSAALIWHRDVTTQLTGGFFNKTRTWSSTLANLNLRLHHATGTTLGSIMSESLSAVDNVELIYQSALAPGDYALRVENTSNTSNTDTPYALAWHSLPSASVVAIDSEAHEFDGDEGAITISRTGDTTLPLLAPLTVSGTAIPGTHYQALPADVTFAAGQNSVTLQIVPISDVIAQGTRTVIVGIAEDFALVRDAAQTATITIEDKSFDAWRFANFTSLELDDNEISGETADPDDDQLVNLIEYALGLLPKSFDVSPVVPIDVGGYLGLSAAKSLSATDISWSAEVCLDLENWTPAVIITDSASLFEARDNEAIDDAAKRFIRLKITRE